VGRVAVENCWSYRRIIEGIQINKTKDFGITAIYRPTVCCQE
jgi:hypothetical protein